ncbi:hypothetical protein [Aliivibrio fischeri]|uniref:hypothetical protein n=1 Tax=Aliivibrio fischeri TaxID=668 RepID=UPI0007C460D5|nr:hypothetical protein [Aliivibrio fischeri]
MSELAVAAKEEDIVSIEEKDLEFSNVSNVKPFQAQEKKNTESEHKSSQEIDEELPSVESIINENSKPNKGSILKKAIKISLLLTVSIGVGTAAFYVYKNPTIVDSFFADYAKKEMEKEKALLASINGSISAAKSESMGYTNSQLEQITETINNSIDLKLANQSAIFNQKYDILSDNFNIEIEKQIDLNNQKLNDLLDDRFSSLTDWVVKEEYIKKEEVNTRINTLKKELRRGYSSQVNSLKKSLVSVKPVTTKQVKSVSENTPTSQKKNLETKAIPLYEYAGYELYDATMWGGSPMASIVYDGNLMQRTEGSRLNRGSNIFIKEIKVSNSRNGQEYIYLFDTKTNKTIKLTKAY